MSKRLERNRRELELLIFVETLALHLEVGFDLSYAWGLAVQTLRAQNAGLAGELENGKDPLTVTLVRLAQGPAGDTARVWFSLLLLLYREGSPLLGAVKAFRRQLVQEVDANVVQHTEEFPQRASLLLLAFFLPPTFVLLFYPLLTKWLYP